MAKRFAIYLRTAVGNGGSIFIQNQRCRDYISNLRGEVVHTFTDIGSGNDLGRPALREMIDAVKQGEVDAVIISRFDRLTRRADHYIHLFRLFKEYGVSLHVSDRGMLQEETTFVWVNELDGGQCRVN